MDFALLGRSVLMGLSIAAPVGPIGLLCMQRTLQHGPRIGFVSGLGAASADALYGALGAFGMVGVTAVFVALAQPLAAAGALFLAWMAWQLWRGGAAAKPAAAGERPGAWAAYGSVLALTLSNPMTILSFVAIFAGLGGGMANDGPAAGTMVLGVALGSAAWWLLLALGMAVLRERITAAWLLAINRLAALVLLGFAGWQLARLAGA
ncbi:LysE family translocator [Chitinimonas sp.]|uniref:LysE family translocator n=1 Tax=Chitinimonas sp. TaxID=1934313 RepID=UPI002F95FA2F